MITDIIPDLNLLSEGATASFKITLESESLTEKEEEELL